MDKVRVLRIIEYEGPRVAVEALVKASIHGEKVIGSVPMNTHPKYDHRVIIRAATIGTYPEILGENDERTDNPKATRE